MTIAVLALAYTLIMGVSAGIKYTAIAFIAYAIGIPFYIWARKQYNKPMFTKGEAIFAIIIVAVAVYGVYALIA